MSGVDHRKRAIAAMNRPENSRCADCLAKDPRWASSKLGVFICINCSGIHRSLGTHISFVRSCTLDVWKDEEASMMERVGNEKGNAYWEAKLPADYHRPASDDTAGMTKFIRQKYEEKKWADPDMRPPNISDEEWAQTHKPKKRRKHRNPENQHMQPSASENFQQYENTAGQGPPKSNSADPFHPTMPQQPQQTVDLFSLDGPAQTPSSTDGQDLLFALGNDAQPPQKADSIDELIGIGAPTNEFDPLASSTPAVQPQRTSPFGSNSGNPAFKQASPFGSGSGNAFSQNQTSPFGSNNTPVLDPFGQSPKQPVRSGNADPFGLNPIPPQNNSSSGIIDPFGSPKPVGSTGSAKIDLEDDLFGMSDKPKKSSTASDDVIDVFVAEPGTKPNRKAQVNPFVAAQQAPQGEQFDPFESIPQQTAQTEGTFDPFESVPQQEPQQGKTFDPFSSPPTTNKQQMPKAKPAQQKKEAQGSFDPFAAAPKVNDNEIAPPSGENTDDSDDEEGGSFDPFGGAQPKRPPQQKNPFQQQADPFEQPKQNPFQQHSEASDKPRKNPFQEEIAKKPEPAAPQPKPGFAPIAPPSGENSDADDDEVNDNGTYDPFAQIQKKPEPVAKPKKAEPTPEIPRRTPAANQPQPAAEEETYYDPFEGMKPLPKAKDQEEEPHDEHHHMFKKPNFNLNINLNAVKDNTKNFFKGAVDKIKKVVPIEKIMKQEEEEKGPHHKPSSSIPVDGYMPQPFGAGEDEEPIVAKKEKRKKPRQQVQSTPQQQPQELEDKQVNPFQQELEKKKAEKRQQAAAANPSFEQAVAKVNTSKPPQQGPNPFTQATPKQTNPFNTKQANPFEQPAQKQEEGTFDPFAKIQAPKVDDEIKPPSGDGMAPLPHQEQDLLESISDSPPGSQNDDLFEPITPRTISDNGRGSHDLFEAIEQPKASDDLFEPIPQKQKQEEIDLFSEPVEASKPKAADDLFDLSFTPEPTKPKAAPAKPQQDDLFDMMAPPAQKTQAPSSKGLIDDMFAAPAPASKPSNDIFGAISSPAPAPVQANDFFGGPTTKAPSSKDLLDDMFSSPAPKPATNDIFGFSSQPTPAPQPAKPAASSPYDLFGAGPAPVQKPAAPAYAQRPMQQQQQRPAAPAQQAPKPAASMREAFNQGPQQTKSSDPFSGFDPF